MSSTLIFRVPDGWHPGEDSAIFLADDGFRIEVPEKSYRENAFQPSFDALPLLADAHHQAE
ncbi:MAG: hypothetical protein JO056_07745 [Alphaproteobacteria bacterium]|nr:hypothetical protein [Alphaproteobacteria bacterium]